MNIVLNVIHTLILIGSFLEAMSKITKQQLCSSCGHPEDKHAFDIVVTDRKNPCELSCMVCFDEETQRLKRLK